MEEEKDIMKKSEKKERRYEEIEKKNGSRKVR